tara:strand:+ start:6813 stop:8066 length:1254 start_codon:yes stop_codon:yes gene_type:complete
MNPNTNTNYLTNSLAKAQQFVGQAVAKLESSVQRKPWGSYQSTQGATSGLIGEQLKNVKAAASVKKTQGVYPSGSYSSVGSKQEFDIPSVTPVAAGMPADVLTNATRRDVWRYTNMHRLMSDVGQHVGPRLGLESPLAGAAVAAAVPVALGMMSGQVGSIAEGLRPKGYKAVAPVSKEEDPSGRKTRSAALETAMRYGLGQKSQLLPYQEFRQERPDVAPSTFVQYRRYQALKPEAGKNVIVDPESQSFSALGGVIRGTARGLNDPEIRLKGVPITASAALGTAAGLGAIKALTYAAEPKLKIEAARADAQGNYNLEQKQYPGFANVKVSGQQGLGVKIAEKLGGYTEPAILAAGAVTAAAVGHAAKKLFQKSAERRIKKENPVEYLKHKHGSLEQASTALGQPQAQSWQQLVPHIK